VVKEEPSKKLKGPDKKEKKKVRRGIPAVLVERRGKQKVPREGGGSSSNWRKLFLKTKGRKIGGGRKHRSAKNGFKKERLRAEAIIAREKSEKQGKKED